MNGNLKAKIAAENGIPESIVDKIEQQARNLLFMHRIGTGRGPVNVSVQTAHGLLRAMGVLVAKDIFAMARGMSEAEIKSADDALPESKKMELVSDLSDPVAEGPAPVTESEEKNG